MSRKKVLTKEEQEAKNLRKNKKRSKKIKVSKKSTASKNRAIEKLLKDFKADDYACPKYGIIKHKKK